LIETEVDKWLARGEPTYNADNVLTWHQSTDFMRSPRFMSAYARGMDSGHQIGRTAGSQDDIHIEWRVQMACWLGRHASRLPGDFVECGVNTGIISLAVCEYIDFDRLGRTFYLFDTFSGIPLEMTGADENPRAQIENDLYYPDCYEQARKNFAPFRHAVLVRGKVPETLASVQIDTVAYLHLDMNIAAPERAAMEHFWPKMTLGGVILLDDYGWTPYRAQKDALDEFAGAQGVEIMMLPTGQGLLIKS
jgi:hypothetical protein